MGKFSEVTIFRFSTRKKLISCNTELKRLNCTEDADYCIFTWLSILVGRVTDVYKYSPLKKCKQASGMKPWDVKNTFTFGEGGTSVAEVY